MSKVLAWSKYIRQQQWGFQDHSSAGPINHLNRLLGEILEYPVNTKNLNLGHHLLFCNQTNEALGTDGYDNYQAPRDIVTNDQLFSRRMWVKGDIQFNDRLGVGEKLECIESVTQVKCLANQAFVRINRNFNDSSIVENRFLLYTNKPFEVSGTAHGTLDLHSYLATRPLSLTPTQILKYSFLTYNLHKIHIDPGYCAQHENLPSVIAQGPFIVTTALHYLNSYVSFRNGIFTYRNIKPIVPYDKYHLAYRSSGSDYNVDILNHNHEVVFAGSFTPA